MFFSYIILIFSVLLFLIGLFGLLQYDQHILAVLMSLEIILLSANLSLILSSFALDDICGQIFSIVILTNAAADSAIGLSIVVIYYKIRGSIDVDLITITKG
uniref:NADH dehydrogenase subunit 4L n=1 Tax=Erythrolobus coxiae TaxID=362235 RepID=UPI001FCD5E14|nr:NADH dehydrogenase subunit 4L [Erythrolobus coxiae]UNJ19003.1 NADH dehydrogenase subunit 4L [Erythrolobus coxiae]